MRHLVVPSRWITGHHTDETGKMLISIFDAHACIIIHLASAQSDSRIQPLRRFATTTSRRIRVNRSCALIGTHPR